MDTQPQVTELDLIFPSQATDPHTRTPQIMSLAILCSTNVTHMHHLTHVHSSTYTHCIDTPTLSYTEGIPAMSQPGPCLPPSTS